MHLIVHQLSQVSELPTFMTLKVYLSYVNTSGRTEIDRGFISYPLREILVHFLTSEDIDVSTALMNGNGLCTSTILDILLLENICSVPYLVTKPET